MTVSVASTEKAALNHCLKFTGSTESQAFTSFAKRFRIRPTGVVSKKDIGARRILCNIWKCRFDEDFNAPKANMIDADSIETPDITMN